ncbi:hypothetical protein VTK73DRAFT_9208 [Phialemonium thermophilum]|uniref:AB hydrolase-1 domain-containing protein n=1 Tax=Phialemonium thermophilum TaxID=223376 RepID=A0ABR3XLG6_9PEZI
MFVTNPGLIQDWTGDEPSPAPLVLIHDGGGTTFSYHLLGSLGRPVYGIANPNFYSGEAWEGGLPDMARHYARLVRCVIPKGPVILGGWSLGGLVSLQIAHEVLATSNAGTAYDDEDDPLRILGIVMIDTGYPKAHFEPPPGTPIVPPANVWADETRPETRAAVTRCFQDSIRMLQMWTPPVWAADDNSHPSSVRSVTEGTVDGSNEEMRPVKAKPPPTYLLRASDYVPGATSPGITMIDLSRQDPLLGWGQYSKDLIIKVEDIPGHHFSVFATDHIDAVTEKLKNACNEIELRATQYSQLAHHDIHHV